MVEFGDFSGFGENWGSGLSTQANPYPLLTNLRRKTSRTITNQHANV